MSSRRQNASSDSPPTSPTLDSDLLASMKLLNLLEPVEKDDKLDEPHQSTSSSTFTNTLLQLSHALSISTVVSTTSSFAERSAEAQGQSTATYRKVGAGACGAVFGEDGRSIVVKLAKASDQDELWHDFMMHTRICEKFKNLGFTDLKIPKCLGFVPKDDHKFWDANPTITDAAAPVCNLPTHGLFTERILPLPQKTRNLLIERYCSERGKQKALSDRANNDCLVRIYLGSLRGRGSQMFFSLRNFKLHLNQMMDLKLDVKTMASKMGRALSIMHWAAKVDARDVEFVLGSATEPLMTQSSGEISMLPFNSAVRPPSEKVEDFYHRKTTMWLLDFNQVRPITMDDEGVAQAVDAYRMNDPYYPRPLQDNAASKSLWNEFSHSYLKIAQQILRDGSEAEKGLPIKFLYGIIKLQQEKQDQGSVREA